MTSLGTKWTKYTSFAALNAKGQKGELDLAMRVCWTGCRFGLDFYGAQNNHSAETMILGYEKSFHHCLLSHHIY